MPTLQPLVTKGIIQKFKDSPEFQRFLMSLQGVTTTKADKVVGGTEDNIVILTTDGNIQDSGQSLTDVEARAFFFARIY